ncbi:MAG: acetyl-CoA carboxylase biotin carboxylase subunit [Acidobacteriota bacterium]
MGIIKKILIANRGEIAVRVIRACGELSIKSVAIFSEVDKSSLHVQMADEAILIGPPSPLESYLNIEKIIETAKKAGCNAIHPGYGFLAENYNFVKRCEEERIIFIGPNSKAMKLVGSKLESRNTMKKAGIPIIPGMNQTGKSMENFKKFAQKIGYPVLIKASGGGGGKGMKIVKREQELIPNIESAIRESKSAFGDESVYLEKYIEEPRHVEFQVLADNFGNAIHLYERECSIQRRYQKLIEETPSTALDDELRTKMGEIAIKVIKVSGYTNAGTVEFLLDKNKNFYFLEVNARIQVEHPVTELVTGIDLVKQQIMIANNEKISIKQEDISQKGHSIECRIYAEDPENNFTPSPGKILYLKEPAGPGIRVDSGIYSGYEVSPYYDPILSKLIVLGENRNSTIERMKNALSEYIVFGIKTTIPFLYDVIQHKDFIHGETYTNFIDKNMKEWGLLTKKKEYTDQALIAAAIISMNKFPKKKTISKESGFLSPWQMIGHWRIGEGYK